MQDHVTEPLGDSGGLIKGRVQEFAITDDLTAGEKVRDWRLALIQVRPDVDPRVLALYQEGVRLRDYANARTIGSDDDVKTATDDLSVIVGLKKAIEAERTKYVGPINGHLRAVNAAFGAFTDPLNEANTVNRGKVLAYRAEQERVRQEQECINALRAEAARAEMELKGELTEPVGLVQVAEEAPARYRTEIGTLGTAKQWHFEVVDFALLPEQYKLPNDSMIRKVVIAGASIPGVRAWQEEGLRVTARKP